MNQDLVSIIIPCYNAEAFIADSIQSALNQTWSDKEVIVIDDGSSDGSLDVIKRFDGRIRWETGPNQGGCLARNRGIELARGEWIQLLDADDRLTPDCVESKLSASVGPLERICCEVGLIQGNAAQELPEWWRQPEWNLEYMLRRGSPQTAAPLHRTEELRLVGGFRPHLPCAQEFDLHVRMAVRLGIRFVSNGRLGVLFRPTSGSVSRKVGSIKMIKAYSNTICEAWAELKKNQNQVDQYAPIVASTLTRCASKLFRYGDQKSAILLSNTACNIHPSWYRGASESLVSRLLVRHLGFASFERIRGVFRRISQK